MLLSPFSGRLADRSERWRRILIANLFYGVVIALYGVIELVPFILILGLIEGCIVSFTQPATDAYLASIADPRIQGRVQGAFITVGMAGAAISACLARSCTASRRSSPSWPGARCWWPSRSSRSTSSVRRSTT